MRLMKESKWEPEHAEVDTEEDMDIDRSITPKPFPHSSPPSMTTSSREADPFKPPLTPDFTPEILEALRMRPYGVPLLVNTKTGRIIPDEKISTTATPPTRPPMPASSSRASYPVYEPRVSPALSAAREAARTVMARDVDEDNVASEWTELTTRIRNRNHDHDQNVVAAPPRAGFGVEDRARLSRPQPRPGPRVAEQPVQRVRVRTNSMSVSSTTTTTRNSTTHTQSTSSSGLTPINAFKSARAFVPNTKIQSQAQPQIQTRTGTLSRTRTLTRTRSISLSSSDPVDCHLTPDSQSTSEFESEFEKSFSKLEKKLGKLTLEDDDDFSNADVPMIRGRVGSGMVGANLGSALYLLNKGSGSIAGPGSCEKVELRVNGAVDVKDNEDEDGDGDDEDPEALARAEARYQHMRQVELQRRVSSGSTTSLATTNVTPPPLPHSAPPSFNVTTTDPTAPDPFHLRHLKRLEAEALRREEAADEKLKGLSVSSVSGRRTLTRSKKEPSLRTSLGGGDGAGVGLDGWWDGEDDIGGLAINSQIYP